MKKIFFLILLAVFLADCKKVIKIDGPIDRITSDEVFSNDATSTLAITGLYNQMMANNSFLMSGAMTLYCGMTSDELVNNFPGEEDEFSTNTISVTNSVVEENFWTAGYSLLYQANAILKGLNNSNGVSGETKAQLAGEAKFARAFILFYLTNIFGDIPLVLTTDYRESAGLGRSPASAVYAQIVDDLIAASHSLPVSYLADDKTRPSKWAALALLSRVYLYSSDWMNAIKTTSSVIDSSGSSLEPDLNLVFKLGSNETLWQLQSSVTSVNTWDGSDFIPEPATVPGYSIRNELLSAFDSSDLRATSWMQAIDVGGTNYLYPFKYKTKSGGNGG